MWRRNSQLGSRNRTTSSHDEARPANRFGMRLHFGPLEWLRSFREWLKGRRRRLRSKLRQRLSLAQILARTLLQITAGMFLIGCRSVGPGTVGGATMLSQRQAAEPDASIAMLAQVRQPGYLEKLTASEREELAKQVLSVALNDPNPLHRAEATAALGLLPLDQDSATVVFTRIANDKSEIVRQCSAKQLGRCLTEASVSTLKRLASNDQDPDVRRAAINALARPDSPLEPTQLVTYLRDPDLTVAQAAANGLATRTGKQLGLDALAWRRELNMDSVEQGTSKQSIQQATYRR